MPLGPLTFGRLQGDVDRLASQINGKAERYEVSQANSRVDSVAHAVVELSSVVSRILDRLEACEEEIRHPKGE